MTQTTYDISKIDVHDVTVRVPCFTTAEEVAMLVWAGVLAEMERRNVHGEPAVMYRKDGDGQLVMFHHELQDPYDGVNPHGLTD